MTATSEPGTTGSHRRRATTTASEPAPTSSVGPSMSPRWRTTPHACSKKFPSARSIPNSLGTWPMMIVSASPMMKPFITGSEMKWARKPSRSRPATRARRPVIRARTTVKARTSSGPPVVRSATAAADRAAVADIGPTTRCRELPNAAYSTRAGGAAYRPTTGDTPAIEA